MTKAKTRKKAVKAVEKAVRKAVHSSFPVSESFFVTGFSCLATNTLAVNWFLREVQIRDLKRLTGPASSGISSGSRMRG
jgi:hypothetical protein